MSCPTVIRVTTAQGPPGIGLPAGTGDAGKYLRKAGSTPYAYELVTPDTIGLPQPLATTSTPTFAGLSVSGLAADRLLFTGAGGALQGLTLGSGLSISGGALVATAQGGGSGTVTSVGLSVPTGFAVGGSPVTGSGTLALTFAAGYSLPTNTRQAQWDGAVTLASTAVQPADLATGLALKADLTDSRFANAREWSAATMTQAEAEEGVSTVRRATNALLLRQSAAAWWQAASGAVGKLLAAATTQAEGRSALGLGSAATAATTDFATPAALATGLAGKADLVGGVVPTSQIPAIAISDFLGTVASQAAMLALVGQRGDWCIRTDGANAGAWILSGEPSSSLANWVQVPMPAVPVQSVNGQVGAVVLGPANVGAATAAQGALAATAIQPGDPALSDAREWSAATVGQAEAEAGVATTRRAWNALRVRQAIEAWWAGTASAVGQSLATAASASAARTTLGLGSAATAASSDFATAAQGAKADTAVQPAALAGYVQTSDARLSDAREWSAATIDQAEAEAGTATTRRAFTAQRVFQAIAAWWAASSAKTKLDGIQANATANATDAQLRDRLTHTGTQPASTISDFTSAARGTVSASGSLSYNPTTGVFSYTAPTPFDPASPGAIGGGTAAAGTFTGLILPAQGSAPAAPATGLRLFANAANAFSWIGANGFRRTFDGTGNTADRVYTLPDASGTVGLLSSAAPANLAATAAVGTASDAARADHVHQFQPSDLVIPLSGEASNLTVSTVLTIPYWPRAQVLTGIPVWMVNTAPAGAALQFDIRIGGVSIFSTLPTIAAGGTNSTTTTAAVFSTAFVSGGQTIALGSSVAFLVTQIGSGTAGAGLKVALPARRAG